MRNQRPDSRGQLSGWWQFRLPALVLFLLGLLTLGLGYWQATWVQGTELNTRTWELRDFSFRRDPFSNYQLSGVTHSAPPNMGAWTSFPRAQSAKLDATIANYFRPAPEYAAPPRWDLVSISERSTTAAGANIVVELLDAYDRDYSPFWPNWSSAHPAQAAILWPAAQDLVALELYAKLPRIFELALLDSPQFSELVAEQVQEAVVVHCQQLVESGNVQDARTAAQIGLGYGPRAELEALLKADNP
ncbi:MAG: hypothetical protein KDA45_06665 [Planctomycetales bacterium]|nr:hypothetical protein [Planctomycetales bacterium]